MGKQYLNGVLYGTGEIIKFSPYIYSLEEREVGVWTDGKPLYQKTVHINTLPSTEFYGTNYEHGISNIDNICDYEGIVRWSNGYVSKVDRCAVMSSSGSSNAQNSISLIVNATNITIYVGMDRSNLSADITIQYTKTTDTPGSGHYTTEGGEAHHYSATEQIVGTWIDGKPLYEKTIDCGALPNATSKNVAHNISNLGFITSMNGMAQRSTGLNRIPLPFVNVDNMTTQIKVMVSDTDINIQCGTDRSEFTQSYITLQYTKITDVSG